MKFPLSVMLLCQIVLSMVCLGQEKGVKIFYDGTNEFDLQEYYQLTAKENIQLWTKNMHQELINSGFLEASVDRMNETNDSLFLYIHTGPKYTFELFQFELNDEELKPIWSGSKKKIISPEVFKTKLQESITFLENRGYPFAMIELKNLNWDGTQLNAEIEVDRKDLITIDSLIIKSENKFNQKFFGRYLKLNKGTVYRETAIREIDRKISSLSYAQNAKSPQVAFKNKEAWIYIYPKRKKANRFNGIIGFIRDVGDEKARITGELDLLLHNALNSGEKIALSWQQLRPKSQDLMINLDNPYIFYTDFGTEFDFKLLKRDSAYLELQSSVGLQYYLEGENYFGVYIKNRQSDVLKENISISDRLSNTSSIAYGLKFNWQELDNPFNPFKGFQLEITGDAGTKKIKKINGLSDEFYQNLDLESDQYNASVAAAYYLPLGKKTLVKSQIKSAFIINDQILENEMLRIGGINSIRGFNEEAITNTGHFILTEELRLLTDEYSNIYVFGDFAWYEKKGITNTIRDTPIGFGVGTSLESALGVFTLNYALGKQFENPISFQNGKIHFGFISIF